MKISFIGHGNMAKAMINGILKAGLLTKHSIYCSNSDDTNQQAIDFSDYIFLTIKPQIYRQTLKKLNIPANKVLISVAPGIRLSSLPGKAIRSMPNTPALIGKGVSAICRNELVSDREYETVKQLFSAFSVVYEFPEDQMDDITALSGSCPAYFYLFIEAIADYSAKIGIDYNTALRIASQTAIGAAAMIMETGLDPQTLTQKVCSPRGTTIEAVEVFKSAGLKEIVARAMAACRKRSEELTEELSLANN